MYIYQSVTADLISQTRAIKNEQEDILTDVEVKVMNPWKKYVLPKTT